MPVNSVQSYNDKQWSQNSTPNFRRLECVKYSRKINKTISVAVNQFMNSLIKTDEFRNLCNKKNVKVLVKFLHNHDSLYANPNELRVKILYKDLRKKDNYISKIFYAMKKYKTYICSGFSGYCVYEAEQDLLKKLPEVISDIQKIV